MKQTTITFFVIFGLMVMLASAHLFSVKSNTSTNNGGTSCSALAGSSKIEDNILKIEPLAKLLCGAIFLHFRQVDSAF